MEIISYKIDHSSYPLDIFEERNLVFIDIETTGLNREKNEIYLIGILYYSNLQCSWILNQYFSTSEKKLLKGFYDDFILFNFNKIITYNGEAFDIPFLNHRFKKHKLDYLIDSDLSFDLYKYIYKYRLFLNLKNLKLTSIEEYLGIFRKNDFNGYQCIKLFEKYRDNFDINLREKILKHNYDDLKNFLDIIVILDIIVDKRSIIKNINNNKVKFILNNPTFEKDFIILSGKTSHKLESNIYYIEDNINFYLDIDKFYLELEIQQALLEDDLVLSYIQSYNNDLIDSSSYKFPRPIYPLAFNKKFQFDNLKDLVSYILDKNI